MSELLDRVIDQFAFIQSSQEKRALKLLRRPIRLRPGQTIKLTHPDYRGPWRLHHKPDSTRLRTVLRERNGGSTPTRFAIYSPDQKQALTKGQEDILLPHRSKPVELVRSKGVLLYIELHDQGSMPNEMISLHNDGESIKHNGLLTIDEKTWKEDVLEKRREAAIAVFPQDHVTELSVGCTTIALMAVSKPNSIELSYSISAS